MYYFYILRSIKTKKLYLGQTNNLKQRLKLHNSGKNISTKAGMPYELIFYSGFKSRKDAAGSEKYFKTTAGWRRLHRMLKSSLEEV